MQPSTREAPPVAPGDVIAGKFRLERVVGRGGMGAVWAARHVQLDMPVAVKFIEAEPGPGADPVDARIRFEREARAAAQIRSPYVAQIIDHGIDTAGGFDRPYIAMELLEGEDLGARLRREGRISTTAMARILGQAAKALRRAHEAGIIHRDLKPGNVFLARFDDDEVVKVLDFGVAKMRRAGAFEDSPATQTGIVFGSPTYMSPEQARGVRDLDHRSDLWSLAVIVFRSVVGVKPFQGASIADLVIKLCIDPLPVATRLAPDLPPAIDRFFERAFARDLDRRFTSAPEMAAAFDAVVAGAAGASPAVTTTAAAWLPPPAPMTTTGETPAPPVPPPPPGAPAAAPPFAPQAPTPSQGLPAPPPPAEAPPPQVWAPAAMDASAPRPAGTTGAMGTPSAGTGLAPEGPFAPPAAPAAGSGPVRTGGTEPTQPTPASGAALPSGGWGLPPTAPPAALPPVHAASPGAPPPNAPRRAPPLLVRPHPAMLAALAVGAVLGVLLVVVFARRGPATARSQAEAAHAAQVPVQVPAATQAIPAVTVPAPARAPEGPASGAATATADAEETDAGDVAGPEASAGPAASAGVGASPTPPGAAAPKAKAGAPGAGKKRRPNFGY